MVSSRERDRTLRTRCVRYLVDGAPLPHSTPGTVPPILSDLNLHWDPDGAGGQKDGGPTTSGSEGTAEAGGARGGGGACPKDGEESG